MTPENDIWIEDYVITLSKEKYSYQQIKKRCKNLGYYISLKDICHKLNLKGKTCLAEIKSENMTTKLHPKTAQTQATSDEVKSDSEGNSADSKQNILEPIFEEILPLYGKDIDKVELHMDKASSHMSKLTATSETETKCIYSISR
ncbi:hypothetical protein TNCV_3192701 [Trichonephila clavipes]|nr:hypothetical protein TNCV_3192701 [Trichonephila clavipes]